MPSLPTRIIELIKQIVYKRGKVVITELLKLIYLIDKKSVEKTGFSITKEDYQIWQYGPVLKDLYYCVVQDDLIVKGLKITVDKSKNKRQNITSISRSGEKLIPDNTVFGIIENKIIKEVLEEHSAMTAKDLVNLLHSEESLWRKQAVELGIYEEIESGSTKTTEHKIDLSRLIEDDDDKLEIYLESSENHSFFKALV